MSCESTEQRIERLETTVKGLVDINRSLVGLIGQWQAPSVSTLKIIGLHNNSQLALMKWLACVPALGGASTLQKLADIVAKAESVSEQAEAIVASMEAMIPPPPGGVPPE